MAKINGLPFISTKSLFMKNLQLKPMDHISVYFLDDW